MKHVLSVLALAAASSLSVPAFAQSGDAATYRSVLSGPAQDPPNGSPGNGMVMIDISNTSMMVDASFRDLVGATVDAHVHCCTTEAFRGVAPVAAPFDDFPTGVQAGTYTASLPLYDEMTYDPAFLASNGGTVSGAASALVDGINANQAYVNIHTSAYPNGEVRGFLVAAPVPEPAEWGMLAMGLAGLLWMGRRPHRGLKPDWQR